MSVDKACVENEVNAWHWGLRYYRRLGMKLSQSGRRLIQNTLGSYLKIASDKDHAKICCERIQNLTGLVYEDYVPENKSTSPGWVLNFNSNFTGKVLSAWDEFYAPKKVEEPVDKRKPWVILKEKQQKRQWRNQK